MLKFGLEQFAAPEFMELSMIIPLQARPEDSTEESIVADTSWNDFIRINGILTHLVNF